MKKLPPSKILFPNIFNIKEDSEDFSNSMDDESEGPGNFGNSSWADGDGGRRVRIPSADVYPGEPPYAAPLTGFHAKAETVFDALTYFQSGSNSSDRPLGFIPVVGLMGDDLEKNKDSSWKLYGRLRSDVYEKLKPELGDINASDMRPVLLASTMRAENLTLLSIVRPHQMFAPSLWLASMPITVVKVPLPTVSEEQVRSISLADKAKAEVIRMKHEKNKKKVSEQMSLSF